VIIINRWYIIKKRRSKMKLSSKEVKEYALECGADVVGVANIERFKDAPIQFDPKQIMPEAKSMIVLGFRVFRGLYRGIEEGTFFHNYSSMGYAQINEIEMPMTLWKYAKIFEDEGYEAIPIPNQWAWSASNLTDGTHKKDWSRPVAPGKAAPDVFIHMRIAAYCAGLGEMGWGNVFLNPVYGPRVRYGALLTEAEIEPDPLVEPGTLCDRCMSCVRECSGNAISKTESVKITIEDKTIEWAKLDEYKCAIAFQGGTPEDANDRTQKDIDEGYYNYYDSDLHRNPNPYNPFLTLPKPYMGYGRGIEGARGCVRACMIHLEKQGKLKNKFKKKFRRRKPWKLEPLDSEMIIHDENSEAYTMNPMERRSASEE
jgi:ferredoxin